MIPSSTATNAPHPAGPSFPVRLSFDHRLASTPSRDDARRLMKAFLLAAGRGTRLRPLTDNIPKCLLPIRGIPLLEIWLELCRNAGIKELLINIHAHAAQVTDC